MKSWMLLWCCLLIAIFSTGALAVHNASFTIDPQFSNCETLGHTFTINVTNDVGDNIFEVRVYEVTGPGVSDFVCNSPPLATGWWMTDFTVEDDYCEYKTDRNVQLNQIGQGESLDIFTFNATFDTTSCEPGPTVTISTLDDGEPEGEHEYLYTNLHVDCVDPELEKSVGDPKILLNPPCDPETEVCDWWVTQETQIDFSASDDTQVDECNTGMDYCEYRVTLDGVPGLWINAPDGAPDLIDWDLSYGNDSTHFLEARCFDIAGNEVYLSETEKVDDTPPETVKGFIGPLKTEEGEAGTIEWIDGVTTIQLNASDPDPTGHSCNIGVDKTWYRIDASESENPCWVPNDIEIGCTANNVGEQTPYEAGQGGCIDSFQRSCALEFSEGSLAWINCVEYGAHNECQVDAEWHLYNGTPISGIEESCHAIQYFSVDYLGNVEESNYNCFFVDKTPPLLEKTHEEGMIEGFDENLTETEGIFHWTTPGIGMTFSCVDEDPHPSGGEQLYLKVSYDLAEDGYVTEEYCAKYNGTMEGDWCRFDMSDERLLEFHFNEEEESLHDLEYYCRDAVNKTSGPHVQYYRVDETPPAIVKTVLGPQVGDCPPEPGSEDECFITNETVINVSVTDPDPTNMSCNVGQVQCVWHYYWNGEHYLGSQFGEEGAQISFDEDSRHDLIIECWDGLENYFEDTETFYVDLLPPDSVKTLGEPKVIDWFPKGCENDDGPCGLEQSEWINSSTPVYINATDAKSGVQQIYWRNLLVNSSEAGEEICGHERVDGDACAPWYYSQHVTDYENVAWNTYTEPFYKNEESCHVIEYYAVDELGNEELLNWNCVFVDNTEPTVNKTVGEPRVPIEGGNVTCNETEGNATVDKLDVLFLFDLTGSMGGVISSAKSEANGLMSDISGLVPDSAFGVGSFMDYDGEFSYCGYTATYGDSGSGDYPWSMNQDITTSTGDVTTAINGLSTAYGADGPEAYARALYESQFASWRSGAKRVVVIFQDNVPHDCTIGSYGSCGSTTGTDPGRDNTAGTGDDLPWGDVASQLDAAGISVIVVETGGSDCGVWQYMADETGGKLANLGEDFTATITGLIGEVIQECSGGDYYVTQQTPIIFDCTDNDGQAHPVDHVTLHYRYKYATECDGLGEASWTDWFDVENSGEGEDPYLLEEVFSFPEDSCHELEYWCEDGLGNAGEVKTEMDIVDTQAPETDMSISEPVYEYEGATYIDNATRISLTAEDPQPHPVDDVETYYQVTWLDGNEACYDSEACTPLHDSADDGWTAYTAPFGIPDQSCHMVEYYSVDALGNEEPVNAECLFADHTPPSIWKEYADPYYDDEFDGYWAEWISPATPIWAGAFDPEPHPSGVASVEYRTTRVDDEYCRYYDEEDAYPCEEAVGNATWTQVDPEDLGEFDFSIGEESCHLIEIRATDNVNKSALHKQCVFVDDTPPEENKTVGIPKSPMSQESIDLGQVFYPELGEGVCETPEKCWDVTIMTPIELGCEDPEPHPSGAQDACFQVSIDGDDVTEDYCEQTEDGDMQENGYCCVQAGSELYFTELTWHKLSYYCTDNVENSGEEEPDMEWFKVFDKTFEIELNKKWNLISVPVKLLDDSMDEVFAGHDEVESVWQYDGSSWHVYTPGPAPDDLTTMVPGWGYWILATDEGLLTIGGNLLDPVMVPPNVPVVHGWNLLGYFGTEDEEGYYGPDGNGKQAQCVFASIGDSIWDKGFTTVYGYWELDNPDVWTSYGKDDNLDPGAGYWVFATEPGIHTLPPKDCGLLLI